MELRNLLNKIDHTLLLQTARWDDIRGICDEGIQYQTASICIPASYVKEAVIYCGGKLPVCTVIGFPNGYSTTSTKCFEAEDAIQNGAGEIDMVINIGWLKDKKNDAVLNEINAVKNVCGSKILKVIIETCLLSEDEKIEMCRIVSVSNADYIKTSTGFSTAGAVREDISLFMRHLAPHIKIKASGGIRSLEDAEDFISLGASRLGTSAVIKRIKENNMVI